MKSRIFTTTKLVLFFVIVIIVAASAPAQSCVQPPNTTMVAWYPFDELAGSTSANLATGNTGTQVNGPLGICGKVSGAASFNGTNQYVESPSTIATNFGPVITPTPCVGPSYSDRGAYSACRANFSIDTWVLVNAFSGVMTIVDKRDGNPPNIHGYSFYLYNGAMGLQLADGAGSQGYTNYPSPPLPGLTNGMWHHLAVSVKRTATNGIAWYYDGFLMGNSNADRLASLVTSSPLRIGANTTAPPLSNWFRGNLDELEIYNRELTAAEVLAIYQADSAGKCKPLDSLASLGHPIIVGYVPDATEIATYDFTVGKIASFITDGRFGGRGLEVVGNTVYYSGLDNSGIHLAPYNQGSGGHDFAVFPNPNPNGYFIQDLDYRRDTCTLYAMTGYESAPPVVYGLGPTDGHVMSSVAIQQHPGTQADGFTVLPDGNFLINDNDGVPTYREYSSSTGQPVTGGIVFTLPVSLATGVDYNPVDGFLYFWANNLGTLELVQTNLNGVVQTISPAIRDNLEDISAYH